jgi:hypothetical protein
MTISDAAELKKLLKTSGFEVYRTVEGRILLAERVRDNLIMDSGIAVGPSGLYGASPEQLQISVTLRAQASHFPGSSVEQLQLETRALAAPFLARGYDEETFLGQSLLDPTDPSQVLDTSFELRLSRNVGVEQLEGELRQIQTICRNSSDD